MRKRLIGKAFAVAMSGAMVFTASPVTANIFNVPAIVKAAEADAAEGYHYCYVGLTWSEYWANEGVLEATNTTSVDELDSHDEHDKGGFDAVTRATVNHGISRASFQCMFTIHATDANGKDQYIDISGFKSGSSIDDDFVLNGVDGKEYAVHKNKDEEGKKTISVDITCDSTKYTFVDYQIKGTKYVPVKVSNDDWAAFSKAYEGRIIENDGTLNCGSDGEKNVKPATYTASVDATTQGLKTATKNSDGTFSFSKREAAGTTSGLKDQDLKTASDVTGTVKDASGSYGEFLRVDFNGDGYGDLGAHMQAVKWTYYGKDSTRTKAVGTYGTKFAADNWMHSKMGIQLGLTDSIRCQLPEGYDGTGYWSLTIYALGYKDYTFDFEATSANIVKESTPATAEEKAALQKVVNEAKSLNQKDYCKSDAATAAFTTLKVETEEAVDLLAKEGVTSAELEEQTPHLTGAIDTVKALQKHQIITVTTPATSTKTGSVVKKCKHCGEVFSKTTIAKIKAPAKTTIKLGSAKKTSMKVSWKKVSGASAYQIQYGTSSSFKGAKTIKVSKSSASKTLTKLKKNKKYYVRVRSYKTIKENKKNKNLYSAWSAKKSLKTKKK